MSTVIASPREGMLALARALETAVNVHDLDALDALVAEDYVEHEGMAEPVVDARAMRGAFGALFGAFPDYRLDIEDVIVDGDRMALRGVQRGTQLGPLGPMAPTGGRMEVLSLDVVRARDGRIAEHWGLSDVEAMARQLGWGPADNG